MNKEEAIDILENCIADYIISEYCEKCGDNKICNERNEDCYYQQAIDTVLNLIQKQEKIILEEKEKKKELEEYANWHIEHLTEDIADYIDDDKKGNASIIGEFKEEREHWKDIIRIMNNEKTYIDYKNY